MLKVNMRQNLTVVIQVATKYSDVLVPVRIIELLESFKSFEGAQIIISTNFCQADY